MCSSQGPTVGPCARVADSMCAQAQHSRHAPPRTPAQCAGAYLTSAGFGRLPARRSEGMAGLLRGSDSAGEKASALHANPAALPGRAWAGFQSAPSCAATRQPTRRPSRAPTAGPRVSLASRFTRISWQAAGMGGHERVPAATRTAELRGTNMVPLFTVQPRRAPRRQRVPLRSRSLRPVPASKCSRSVTEIRSWTRIRARLSNAFEQGLVAHRTSRAPGRAGRHPTTRHARTARAGGPGAGGTEDEMGLPGAPAAGDVAGPR